MAPLAMLLILTDCTLSLLLPSIPQFSVFAFDFYFLPHCSGLTRLIVSPMHFCHSQAICNIFSIFYLAIFETNSPALRPHCCQGL